MRHKKKGRKLGRSPSHLKAMLRNMASSLFLSERDEELNEAGETYREYDTPAYGLNKPKVKGRITTTVPRAKQLQPLVERCITIACKGLLAEQEAEQYGSSAERRSPDWRQWRESEDWNRWAQAMAPAVVARRRVLQLIRNKAAMKVLFNDIAPRFMDRPGGYTRIVRLASPRLGDAGTRAILEFVGTHDRVSQKSERPAFADEEPTDVQEPGAAPEQEATTDQGPADEQSEAPPPEEEGKAKDES